MQPPKCHDRPVSRQQDGIAGLLILSHMRGSPIGHEGHGLEGHGLWLVNLKACALSRGLTTRRDTMDGPTRRTHSRNVNRKFLRGICVLEAKMPFDPFCICLDDGKDDCIQSSMLCALYSVALC